MDTIEAVRRDHVTQHLHRVVLDDAHVGERLRIDQFQQIADAGGVHLDAEIIILWLRGSDGRRGFAHAETDFENFRRSAAEQVLQIQLRLGKRHAITRQQGFAGALLRVGNAALTQNVAADVAWGIDKEV